MNDNKKMINIINGNDIYQRYKMPSVNIKYQGKKFTIITNIKDISKSIHIKNGILDKFLAIENNTNNKNEKFNGVFELKDIQDQIYLFIEQFVLCEYCGLPELKHKACKGHILNKCMSCGEKYLTKSNHKVKNYWSNKYEISFNPKKYKYANKEKKSLEIEQKRVENLEYKINENYCSVQNIDYVENFLSFIKINRSKEQVIEKIKMLKLAYNLNEKNISMLLLNLLDMTSWETFEQSYILHEYVFIRFINNCNQFLQILNDKTNEKIIKKSYRLIYMFYDRELFTEEQLNDWYYENTYDNIFNEFKNNSKVVFDWLKNAEYED